MRTTVPTLAKKEARRLLTSRLGLARLATADQCGKPHVVPTWFLYSKDTIYIPSPSTTLKAKNIQRNPQVSVTVDSYSGVLAAQGLLLEGTAHILTGQQSAAINRTIHKKYIGSKRIGQKKWKEFMAEDDITIVVKPRTVRSWNFRKLKL